MFLRHFTWPQFLVAALVFGSVWYGVVWLRYRQLFSDWLKKKNGMPSVEPLRRVWEDDLELGEGIGADSDEVLGKPKLPEGVSRVSMDELRFAEVEINNARERQQGLVPDALEEIKSIFLVLEKENGTKADFISLFALVKAKYAALRGTPGARALNEYIRERALFAISDEELMNLWA